MMKRNTTISKIGMAIVLQLICLVGFGQNTFPTHTSELSFGFNGIDRNVRADHWLHTGRHGFRLGLKYTIKHFPKDDQGYSFFQRAFPLKFGEHFGFQLGYTYEWFRFSNKATSYLFYDLQFSRPTILGHSYFSTTYFVFDSLNQKQYELYTRYRTYTAPSLILEQNIGLGLTIPITKDLVLNQMVGVGLLTYRPDFRFRFGYLYPQYSPIYSFVRVGLCWKWHSNSPK